MVGEIDQECTREVEESAGGARALIELGRRSNAEPAKECHDSQK